MKVRFADVIRAKTRDEWVAVFKGVWCSASAW